MATYSGKYQSSGDAEGTQQGACQVTFDADTVVLTPSPGAPTAFDLGDVESVAPGEWELKFTLYTGQIILLRQFGAAFSNMCTEFMAAWRDRTVRCLMLEDLKEIERFNGTSAIGPTVSAPAEIRLYASNLAILPQGSRPIQWRLAEIDSVEFDSDSYTVMLHSGKQRLRIGRLGKRTDEFTGKLQTARDALRTQSAAALLHAFPFLTPGQVQRLTAAMPEGRSVALSALAAINPDLPDALVAQTVSDTLKPYFDTLRTRAAGGELYAGFKFIREDEAKDDSGDDAEEADGESNSPLFFWFFFPQPNGMVAWEAVTGSGRATYFFRVSEDLEAAVAQLTRGLALINFRREPIYLPDQSLAREQKYHRYAIGARKLPDLQALRTAYVKRAIHSSLDDWKASLP